jgi:hypothetical protein
MKTNEFRVAFLVALVCAIAISGCSVNPNVKTPTAKRSEALSQAIAPVFSGDMTASREALQRLDLSAMPPNEAKAASCMLSMFESSYVDSQIVDVQPKLATLVAIYRSYWLSLLMRREESNAAEEKLRRSLIELLRETPQNVGNEAMLDDLSDRVVTLVERHGLHALTGVTSPYHELMIWKTEEERRFPISLVEGSIEVPVVFIDNFVSEGWLRYATCGLSGTGGWATKEKLFALRSRYDLSSESFHASYLHHEGQHFFDYLQFPLLEQPELEYRAKLAELIATKTDAYLIESLEEFSTNARRGRDAPHPHAEFWLVHDLRKRVVGPTDSVPSAPAWRASGASLLREAARSLLLESSAQIKRLGATTTKRYLPD